MASEPIFVPDEGSGKDAQQRCDGQYCRNTLRRDVNGRAAAILSFIIVRTWSRRFPRQRAFPA